MNSDKNKIFNYTHHLSDEQLSSYVYDKLTAIEKHHAEKHCVDCELCNDALEGLLLLKQQGKLPAILNQINDAVQPKSEHKTKIFYLDTRMRVAIAAGIALLVVAIFLFKNQLTESTVTVSDNKRSEETMPDEQKNLPNESSGQSETKSSATTQPDETKRDGKTAYNAPIPKKEEHNLKEKGVDELTTYNYNEKDANGNVNGESILMQDEKQNKPSAPVVITQKKDLEQNTYTETEKDKLKNEEQSKNERMDDNDSPPKKLYKNTEKQSGKKKFNSNKQQEITNNAPSSSQPSDDGGVVNKQHSDSVKGGSFSGYMDMPNGDVNLSETKTVTSGNTSSNTTTSTLGQAFVKFNQKKYANAAELYTKVLVAEPNNFEALFYLEQCNYHLKKYADVSICANKIIADGKSIYVEGAKYYLAMALIEQGNTAEAKKYLEQVKQKNASYKTEADIQLEKIK